MYGLIPVMVPTASWFVDHLPLWNSVFIFSVKEFVDRFGDEKLLCDLYPDLVNYTERSIRRLQENDWLWGAHPLGDWVSPLGKADMDFFETDSEGSAICVLSCVYQTLKVMTMLAERMNNTEDASRYADAAKQLRDKFHQTFYRTEEALYDTGVFHVHHGRARYRTRYRQTSNLLPLAFGLVSDEDRQRVFDRLCQDVEEKGCHLDTGCIGTPYILPVLTDMGRPDLAYRILTQTTYPSWGFWIAQGADTMWEMWESTARSRDHYFLGTCEEFFYSHIVGIREISEGWRSYTIQPAMMDYFDSAGATIQTVRGNAACHWFKKDGQITMEITVPFGSIAMLVLPAFAGNTIQSDQCSSMGMFTYWGDTLSFPLAAGKYQLQWKH